MKIVFSFFLCCCFLFNTSFSLFKKGTTAITIQIPPSETKEQYISYRKMIKTVHMSITYPKDLIEGKEYIFRYVHGRLWWYYISDLDYDTEGRGFQHRLVNKLVNKKDWEEAWVNSVEIDTPVQFPIWWLGDINQSGYIASRRGEHPECNNPFNIVYNKQTRKLLGCKRQDKYGFCMFETEELGRRAGMVLILGYRRGGFSLTELAEEFPIADKVLFFNTMQEKMNMKGHHLLKNQIEENFICSLANEILNFINPNNCRLENKELQELIDKYKLLDNKSKLDNVIFYGDSIRKLPLNVHHWHPNNQLDGIIPGSKVLCH